MLVCTKFYHKENTDKIISSLSNEISPLLVTRFLVGEWWNIRKKTFTSPFLKHRQEGRRKIKYKGHCEAFCIRHKRKKENKKGFLR